MQHICASLWLRLGLLSGTRETILQTYGHIFPPQPSIPYSKEQEGKASPRHNMEMFIRSQLPRYHPNPPMAQSAKGQVFFKKGDFEAIS